MSRKEGRTVMVHIKETGKETALQALEQKTLLIVDDYVQITSVIKRLFSPYFDDIIVANTIGEAVRALSSKDITHIVCESYFTMFPKHQEVRHNMTSSFWREWYRDIERVVVFTVDTEEVNTEGVDAVVRKSDGTGCLLKALLNFDSSRQEVIHLLGRLVCSLNSPISRTESIAAEILKIAEVRNWFKVQCTVMNIIAAKYIKEERIDEALKVYRSAKAIARTAQKREHKSGAVFEAHFLMQEASLLFVKKDIKGALTLYKNVATIGEIEDEPGFALESWSMALCCYELLEKYGAAIQCGRLALSAGERIDADSRPRNSLANVGDALIRLWRISKENKKTNHFLTVKEICTKMESLLGKNWQTEISHSKDAGAPMTAESLTIEEAILQRISSDGLETMSTLNRFLKIGGIGAPDSKKKQQIKA